MGKRTGNKSEAKLRKAERKEMNAKMDAGWINVKVCLRLPPYKCSRVCRMVSKPPPPPLNIDFPLFYPHKVLQPPERIH